MPTKRVGKEKSSQHLHTSLAPGEPKIMDHFPVVTSNFPSLRKALHSIGLNPTFIDVEREAFSFCDLTIVITISLQHTHLPAFYQQMIAQSELDVDMIWGVCLTKVKGTKVKPRLEFPLTNDRREGLYWLDEKRSSLHLDLKTGEWYMGSGRMPESTREM